MRDQRVDTLARILVQHSTRVQPGENVYIEAFDMPDTQLVERLIEEVSSQGGVPYVSWKNNAILRTLLRTGPTMSLTLAGETELNLMQKMQAYIGIRGTNNTEEFQDISPDKMKLYQQEWWHKVHLTTRVPKTKWVVLRYPTASMAQSANMSTQAFEDFYFRVCTCDYPALEVSQQPLKLRMENANHIRLVAPGTDISFRKEKIPVIPCFGRRNIPDGEIFTSPVKDSVNGVIQYNTGSRYQGHVFQNIRFEFKDGKIIKAEAGSNTERLNQILDTDEGARYIGEWSLGLNHEIKKPMLDTLFDEKIGGSLHFTPGNAYETADNGNRSQIHWDLVLIQTPEYGGGEVWFDGELIRKDGIFLPEDLQGLNPQ